MIIINQEPIEEINNVCICGQDSILIIDSNTTLGELIEELGEEVSLRLIFNRNEKGT